MKNTTTRAISVATLCLVLTLSLAGCFSDDAAKTQSNPPDSSTTTTVPDTVTPPTYKDGTAYLDAIGSKDVKLCAQIKDEKLKLRCKTEVSALPK